MFRNQYDNDVTTWSPQGRLHQVEYAMEAVKQGSCTVGLKSKSHVVLLGLKRSANELSSYQKKILVIDDFIACAFSGLTSDARVLSKFMRSECLHSKFSFDSPLPVKRLVSALGDKAQVTTQQYGRRPFGVGLLIAGFSENSGPELFQLCPSANYFSCKAMAIGSRSQSSRTYLEKNLDSFQDATLPELIRHGLLALKECLPNEAQLTLLNTSVMYVGENSKCCFIDENELEILLSSIQLTSQITETASAPTTEGDDPSESHVSGMDIDQ